MLLVRELIELQGAPSQSIEERRERYERAEAAFGADSVPPGEQVVAGGREAEWVRPRRRDEPVLLYLHGGAYAFGSPRSHRHLAATIGAAAQAAVLSLDYRRAPEHPFPAAVDDAVAACRWLLGLGVPPARMALAGDSAGGGLAVAAMLAARDAGEPLPAAGAFMSPWFDLTCETGTHRALAERDPVLNSDDLRRMARLYLGGADPRHPLASPAFADLRGLPPLLVQVGSEEILLDEARAFARSAGAAGVWVRLEEWPDMVHVWHWYFPVLDEARQAIDRMGDFLRRALGGDEEPGR
jgi:phosphinothricin tripeptide acetyl hydrolase